MRRPVKIGITWGIGSGKSTICRMFAMLGAPYYDCDARAKDIMEEDPVLIKNIKAIFGDNAYSGGKPDRAYLASKVFTDRDALEKLNAMVHPAVINDFRDWLGACPGDVPYAVMESAILFESGLENEVDYVITVSAPESTRIERTMERDGLPREKVEARIANQMTDSERERRSDLVIKNDDRELVWEQVTELDALFRKWYNENRK